ncbi:MAG: sigma-70 family RNA polymerase sigma factor [Lachnoclostridium sp.]|nr:sigma-70 family RNA polymerase sigma factor [Lachnospira sp.]MCM1249496.1 sigma-70 family RNA polymerase sigma factor [Lachnoclostridium sp.]MCM1536561.1 sigma-70 family RNA polymerase sigma factor [Clostridium sp.]
MEDDKIVELYWRREESAIHETEKKYGHYLTKVAYNVLADWEDSKECVNDTYLKAWNTIPPLKPSVLSPYLGKLTRQAAIDIYRRRNSVKRKPSEYALSLGELEECVSGGNTTEQEVDLGLLAQAINHYLKTLPVETRDLFIGRYYYADSIRKVASYYNMSEAKAKSILHRTRIKLKEYLKREGFFHEA